MRGYSAITLSGIATPSHSGEGLVCIVVHCTQKLGYPIRLFEIYMTLRYRGICEVSTGKQEHLRTAWCHRKIAMSFCELVDHL